VIVLVIWLGGTKWILEYISINMNRYIEARQRRAQKRVTLCDEIGHPKIEDFGAKLHQNGAQECSETFFWKQVEY